ncbi:MAG: HEPN domain-containing protein [Bacillota bacterium]
MNKGKQQKELVYYWLGKARESMESARSELSAGRLDFTVNRLYYVLFYLVTAALTAKGEKLGKHSAVRAAFHKNFVRTGKVDKSYGRLYDELFHARHQGDYVPLTEFDETVVRQQLQDVEKFLTFFSKVEIWFEH